MCDVSVTLNALFTRFRPDFHTKPKNFENGVLTLKMLLTFSVHTTLQKFENAPITSHCGFGFGKIPFSKFFINQMRLSFSLQDYP